MKKLGFAALGVSIGIASLAGCAPADEPAAEKSEAAGFAATDGTKSWEAARIEEQYGVRHVATVKLRSAVGDACVFNDYKGGNLDTRPCGSWDNFDQGTPFDVWESAVHKGTYNLCLTDYSEESTSGGTILRATCVAYPGSKTLSLGNTYLAQKYGDKSVRIWPGNIKVGNQVNGGLVLVWRDDAGSAVTRKDSNGNLALYPRTDVVNQQWLIKELPFQPRY